MANKIWKEVFLIMCSSSRKNARNTERFSLSLRITDDYALTILCGEQHKVLNSSGKFAGLQPNRLLRLENGDPYDVVCGTFFLAGLGGETFVSLTPEQLRKYESLYSREMLFPLPKKKERRNEHER